MALLAVIVAMIGLMFAVGQKTPKLALDLAGGTTVTLTAVTEQGKTPPSQQMNQAVSIMRERVNGLGVSEAEVSRQGNDVIIVQVPGQGQQRVVDLIGTTAKLQFRQVFAEAAGSQTNASASPSPSATGTAKTPASPSPSSRASASSASPSTSASPKKRALSSALTAASPSPSASASPSASPKTSGSPSPSATPTSSGQVTAASLGLPAGVPQAVIDQYVKANCSGKDRKLANAANDKSDWVAACAQDGATKYILGPVRVQGTEVKSAQSVAPNIQSGQTGWTVQLSLKSKGSNEFYKLTTDTYNAYKSQGQYAPQALSAIILDGQVVTALTSPNGPISTNVQIEGSSFTQQTSSDLAQVLNYGALPLEFKKSAIESVSATLGQEQLKAGLYAGAIGLALVVLYCLMYYRALGLVAILSLCVSGVLTYLSVVLLGHFIDFRLSLAGIAGLIVAIGITADSFVVYFERLRDEVREGRSLRSAVERGWERARRTVLVADAVSFLAALVLWLVSIGSVKGFAFTLGLTTLIDVVVVFLFTKPMITWLARLSFFGQGHPMSGLDPRRLGAKQRTPRRTTGSTATSTATKEA